VAVVPLLSAQNGVTPLQQAVDQLKAGHAQAAVQILDPVIKSQPDNVKGLTLMGMAVTAAGKAGEANTYFERALSIRPAYIPALRGLAMNEVALKKYENATRHFEQLLTASPADPVAHAGLGEIAFFQGNSAAAVQEFEQTGSLYHEDPRILLEYAKAAIALKEAGKAGQALENMPDTAECQAHFEAGALLAALQIYKAAARQFELALPNYPDRYSAGYNLVLAKIKSEDYPDAIESGQKLIAAGYRKAELYNLLAEAYEKTGNTQEAYNSLRTATRVEPSDETNYIDLITLCIDHKNYDLGAEIAGVGLSKLPASERLHLQLGIVFAMKEQFGEARNQFKIAADLAPDRSLPHVAMALALMQMNRPIEAVEELRRRVRESPNDYLALWFLGEALNRAGIAPGSPEQKEAIDALERSVRINPEISQSQELFGKLLAHDNKLQDAAAHLQAAIRLDPENVGAVYQLAQVYSRLGDSARSKPLFAKLSKMKAEDREKFANRQLQQILRAGSQ
jgi:tetratricopeptide (TPR) repeat protein